MARGRLLNAAESVILTASHPDLPGKAQVIISPVIEEEPFDIDIRLHGDRVTGEAFLPASSSALLQGCDARSSSQWLVLCVIGDATPICPSSFQFVGPFIPFQHRDRS